MTMAIFVVTYVAAAFALAFWFDVRFPKLRPSNWRTIGIASAATYLSDTLCTSALGHGPRLVGVMAIVLPSIALTFLVCIWMMRMMRSSMPA